MVEIRSAVLLVERARSGDGVLEAVEQVGRGVAVDVGEISHALDGVVDPGHLRIQVGQDLVAVCNRLAEAVTQPVEGLRRGGQRLVQLDRVDLL